MRRAISLIELIFTIVIIAMVFTVIPKMVLALNKSDSFAIKQDALFNGITLTQMISRLSWDEMNANTNDILNTTSGSSNLECNGTTFYRKGGFVGSRNCKEFGATKLASSLGMDGGETSSVSFNDIDDFNGQFIEANASSGKMYDLNVTVKYIQDAIVYASQKATIYLTETSQPPTTNLKMVDVNITYQGKRTQEKGSSIARFSYISSNLGQTRLNKRAW